MPNTIKLRKSSKLETKFIFVSGGVISGVGKGVTTASIATTLQARGYKVAPVKCDAYLNVDAGTIRPQEHGEVFVTDDGMETDQDLGNYERFLNTNLSKLNYVTNGQIFLNIIQKERNFGYNGEDVEVAFHVPEEIIRRLELVAKAQKADFVICEIGGTVGEYQNILFIEANRIMKYRDNKPTAHIHVGYLPTPPALGEMKSKPVQNSIRQLIATGIQPDFLIARAESPLDERRKQTLAWATNISAKNIISAPNVDTIYRVPLNFDRVGLTDKILTHFNLPNKQKGLKKLNQFITKRDTIKKTSKILKIAIVGKYFETGDNKLADVYISVIEALKHGAWANNANLELHWISSLAIEKQEVKKILTGFDGICVPGGFGNRGVEGIIEAIKFARINKVPFLGLCYGMQLAVVEFARNVCKLRSAHTVEVNPETKHPVINLMPEQEKLLLKQAYGATMRLGAWDCILAPHTKTFLAYERSKWGQKIKGGALKISERHRHRYEFNNTYRQKLENKGLIISGTTTDHQLVEIIELENHPFFIATQFHPEFKSRPLDPHPLFKDYFKAILKHK